MAEPDFYFNPFDPEFRANPYPHFPKLLDGPPRQLNLFMPATVVARYADVVRVLHDHEHFTVRRPETPLRQRLNVFGGAPTILTADPPVHTRLRKLVSKAFTPKRVRELEARIREITGELLLNLAEQAEFDAMAALANPLPVIVIAELLGVSAADHAQFKQWSNDLISSFGQDAGAEPSPAGLAAREALHGYLADAIEMRRANPANDLISALVSARDESDALSESELLAFVVLLLLAGNETTTNLIGNGLLALCRYPDQQQRLRENRELVPKAVEEMLRYDPPVQMTVRIPTVAVNVGGTEIPSGSLAFILLAAANRDPAKFPHPELFDIGREPNEHVAFGEGIHFCLGAPLARLEGAIAIESILKKFPRLQLAKPDARLEYRGSMALRGLSKLPLSSR
ncbi:MAG TPA: cytochrome P450 [Candidatus Binataceae bacterium]|nr:cytochrome P450 [Candidatus Binataceae bacterium]